MNLEWFNRTEPSQASISVNKGCRWNHPSSRKFWKIEQRWTDV